MNNFEPQPFVVGLPKQNAPLVVLLHGRGSDASDIISLAAHLPLMYAYVALRAPIQEGPGFAWFKNKGIGRPVAQSLANTMAWFDAWLDRYHDQRQPVFLVGFSGGAAFAGGLLLSRPTRYAGVAILNGTLPFDAGLMTDAGQLSGTNVFVSRGKYDSVIPRELLDRTLEYLTEESGALTQSRLEDAGHEITQSTLAALAAWLIDRTTVAGYNN